MDDVKELVSEVVGSTLLLGLDNGLAVDETELVVDRVELVVDRVELVVGRVELVVEIVELVVELVELDEVEELVVDRTLLELYVLVGGTTSVFL